MCRFLSVSAQGYRKWVKRKDLPNKHAVLLAQIQELIREDIENENYGIRRMYEALKLRYGYKQSQSLVARVMRDNGLVQKKLKAPKGFTKADKKAQKSDDLLKRNFLAAAPNKVWVTDITQLSTADGPLYISAIFDCFDNATVGLSMDDNMRKELVIRTVKQAMQRYPADGVILHSDRGSQYTSGDYRVCIKRFNIRQSMNSAGGRCHDNAKCESVWARAKVEKFYKHDTAKMSMDAVKQLVFRYFFGYWNNRRICSANGGFPPLLKRALWEQSQLAAA